MNERPIPFTGPMVRAILEGTKTQTRRLKGLKEVNSDPSAWTWDGEKFSGLNDTSCKTIWPGECPYGIPGDQLWVREGVITCASIPQIVGYVADGCKRTEEWEKFRNSRFMPRWASRITLEITDVRVQRLQEISEKDAMAEGVIPRASDGCAYFGAFRDLWDSLNAKRGFSRESNSWVWAITFKRIQKNEVSA